jgi:hypothetical protein
VSVLASRTEHVPENNEGTCTVSFRVGESQFSATTDAAYSILHYKSLPFSILRKESEEDTLVRQLRSSSIGEDAPGSVVDLEVHQPHTELLFREINRLGVEGDNTYSITRMKFTLLLRPVNTNVLKVYHDTITSQRSGPRTVRMNSVLVMSERTVNSSLSSMVERVKCDAVDIEFADSSGKTRLQPIVNIVSRPQTQNNFSPLYTPCNLTSFTST